MAQQTLQTVVAISGRIDNSFGKIGDTLINVGSQIDMLSQKIINFGKDSVQRYINYDDTMREVKALGKYSDAQMALFDAYNKEMAQQTIFKQGEIAQAETLMAQLGLQMDDIKKLMPSVLDLSIAAKTSTDQSLNYIYYTLRDFGMGMEEAQKITDQMTWTASIGATNVDTLGQSFQRMGSALQLFTGGSAEVLAILNGIGQFGDDMQGTKAGTQLRNFMLTLVAPTTGKAKLLDTLKVAGVSAEEFENYLNDAGYSAVNAAETMKKLKFSVYDANGQIKPAIQIIDELKRSLSGLGEDEQNQILGNLFGKRTYVAAKNMLSIATSDYLTWKKSIEEESAGYAKTMADTMQEGPGGEMRRLERSMDTLKQTAGKSFWNNFGESIAPLRGVIDSISNMDEGKLDALTSGASVIAVAGPALTTAGIAFKVIGTAISGPVGWLALAATVLPAAAAYLDKIERADLEGKFGTMALDMDTLRKHVKDIGAEFDKSFEPITQYSTALDTAVESYKNASSEFSSKLTTLMLTGATLTEADESALRQMGTNMIGALKEGIQARGDRNTSFLQWAFGGEENALTNELYKQLIDEESAEFIEAKAKANQLGKELSDALTSAFLDGKLTPEEKEGLRKKMEEVNEYVSELRKREDYVNQQVMLDKAQNVNLNDLETFIGEVGKEKTSRLEKAREATVMYYSDKEYSLDRQLEQATTQEEKDRLIAEKKRNKEQLDTELAKRKNEVTAEYDNLAMTALDSALKNSGLGGSYNQAMYLAEQVMQGNISIFDAKERYWSKNMDGKLRGVYGGAVKALGGEDMFTEAMERYAQLGDYETGRKYAMYAFMNDITKGSTFKKRPEIYSQYITGGEPEFGDVKDTVDKAQAYMNHNPLKMEAKLPDDTALTAAFVYNQQAYLDANPGRWKLYIDQLNRTSGITNPAGGRVGGDLMMMYAEGGYADKPSIFGEAGGEWAIPEQHTQNTAELLDKARQGSGFTWPELIARNGGLNAKQSRAGTKFIYSPVIHANDARGVEDVLMRDKERLDRWWEEKHLKEDIGVYM